MGGGELADREEGPAVQLELGNRPLSLVPTAPAPAPPDHSASRQAAALEIVRGYERAITKLDPSDGEELRWYRARLRDARLAAGLAPLACVEHRPRADERLPA